MAQVPTSNLPQPPFYQISNLNNLRDAALYEDALPTSTPNTKVRPGILFRSADVSKLDRSGWSQLKSLGISHVFDLRSKPEVEKGVTRSENQQQNANVFRAEWIDLLEQEGLTRVWCPVFEASDYSPERLADRYMKYMGETVEGFIQAYYDILTHAGPAFRTIFLYLVSLPPPQRGTGDGKAEGALIHCTGGKDRTGLFYGILFAFLGVPVESIAAEYNLTELGLLNLREDLVSRLMALPGFKKFIMAQMNGKKVTSDELKESLSKKGEGSGPVEEELGEDTETPPEVLEEARVVGLRMLQARKETMVETLKLVEREWGSAEGYMRKECRLGDQELEALRRNLVVPVDVKAENQVAQQHVL